MKWLIYHLVLRPLIFRNYDMRARNTAPDVWYWADSLACSWGYLTDYSACREDMAA